MSSVRLPIDPKLSRAVSQRDALQEKLDRANARVERLQMTQARMAEQSPSFSAPIRAASAVKDLPQQAGRKRREAKTVAA